MVTEKSEVDSFTRFVVANESKLRHALIAACGGEVGGEVAQEVLAYGWEHWERLQSMENPVGYLYVMGRNLSRRRRRTGPVSLRFPSTGLPMSSLPFPRLWRLIHPTADLSCAGALFPVDPERGR